MARFEERAPLDFTKVSTKTELFVCPHCKTGKYRSIDFESAICGTCNEYFNRKDCLIEDEMLELSKTGVGNKDNKKSAVLSKLRNDLGGKADVYKAKVENQIKSGTQRSHEPDGKKRKW